MEMQQGQVGGLGTPAGTLTTAWVVEGSGHFYHYNTIATADVLSWRARRRLENLLSNVPNAFRHFDLQPKLAKWGLKACRSCKIGLVS